MLRKKVFLAALCLSCMTSLPVLAQSVAVKDIQDLPSATAQKVDDSRVLDSSKWEYKTLANISKKYGLLLGKFDGTKPLTRNEAAVILVSLEGKIKQDNLQLTDVEKDRVEIIKQELSGEITALAGRVSTLETSVNTLNGSVSKLQSDTSKDIQIGYGDKFKVTGGFQFKYTGNINSGKDTTGTTYPSSFNIPISDFTLSGNIAQHLRYNMSIYPFRTYGNGSNTLSTKGILGDAYLATDIIKNNTIYAGQERVPLGQEGAMSPYATDFANKAQIGRNYGDYRAPGLKVAGNYPFMDYYAGVFSGNRDNGVDTVTRQMEYASWVILKPLYQHPAWGKLELGGGYDYGKSDYAVLTTPFSHDNTGFYTAYSTPASKEFPNGRDKICAEFAFQKGYLTPTYTTASTTAPPVNAISRGWYINNSYFLTKNLQLEGRIDVFDPATITRNNLNEEYSVGTNYYMLDKHLKLMVDYVYVYNQSPATPDSSRIVAMSQYQF